MARIAEYAKQNVPKDHELDSEESLKDRLEIWKRLGTVHLLRPRGAGGGQEAWLRVKNENFVVEPKFCGENDQHCLIASTNMFQEKNEVNFLGMLTLTGHMR